MVIIIVTKVKKVFFNCASTRTYLPLGILGGGGGGVIGVKILSFCYLFTTGKLLKAATLKFLLKI